MVEKEPSHQGTFKGVHMEVAHARQGPGPLLVAVAVKKGDAAISLDARGQELLVT